LLDDTPFEVEAFAKTVTDFVTKLSPSSIRKKKPAEIDFTESKRNILIALMQILRMKTGVRPTLLEENTSYPFADVAINSNCTLCTACVTMCPTKALSKADNKIDFVYGNCIACGMCQQACPEEAIALKRVLDFSQLVEEGGKKLVEVEFVACAGCEELFMPKSAFERMSALLKQGEDEGELNIEERLDLLKYCQKCRPVRAVEMSLEKLENE
jgi:ferredoxin